MNYDAVSRNERTVEAGPQPLPAGECGGRPRRKIAARAEREGLMLEEKPVSIAVQEIADGKLDEPVEEVMQEEGVLQGRFAHEQENAPGHEQPPHAAPVEATPAEPAFEEAAPVLESAAPAEEPAPATEDAEKPAE